MSARLRSTCAVYFGLSLLLAGTPARADLVAGPEEFVLPSLFILFVIFVAAMLIALAAKGLLLMLRKKTSQPIALNPVRVALTFTALAAIPLALFTIWVASQPRQRPKTSEAKSNLGAIRSTEVAYFAEWNVYIGGQPLTPVADRRHRPNKERWDPNTRFSIIGFAPEGNVFFSYSLEGPAWSAEGFTATAVADVDDDGEVSVYSVNNTSNEIMKSGAPF